MTIRFRLPVALALPLAYIAAAGAQPTARPNIVYIMSADHPYQAISAYGSSVSKLAPPPNIDRIENKGAIYPPIIFGNSPCRSHSPPPLTRSQDHPPRHHHKRHP